MMAVENLHLVHHSAEAPVHDLSVNHLRAASVRDDYMESEFGVGGGLFSLSIPHPHIIPSPSPSSKQQSKVPTQR